MKKISRNALLPYSAEAMFILVNDVASYPEFLPWCGGSEVIHANDKEMTASVTIAKAGLSQTFTTQNHIHHGEQIVMELLDGPFSSLNAVWQFKVLDEHACKISFDVEFEVKNALLNAAIGTVFEQIASTLVQSFCERAKQVYG